MCFFKKSQISGVIYLGEDLDDDPRLEDRIKLADLRTDFVWVVGVTPPML